MNVHRRVAGALTVVLIALALASAFDVLPWWPVAVVGVIAGAWWAYGLLFVPGARGEREARHARRSAERAGRRR